MLSTNKNVMDFKNRKHTPDWIGITSSGLCLVPCLVLPVLIFLPFGFTIPGLEYWDHLDYVFLISSFMACYFTSRRCTTKYMVALLWSFFGLLALSILLLKFSDIFEYTMYLASTGLIISHSANIKYCKSSFTRSLKAS